MPAPTGSGEDRRMPRILTAVVLATAALLLPATLAQAATVSLDKGTIVYQRRGLRGPEPDRLHVPAVGRPEHLPLARGQRRRPQIVLRGPASSDANFGGVLCPLDPSQPLRIEGSNGNDRLSIFSNDVPDAKPIQMHGNGGNDEIEDVFISTAGRVLTGGPGNDTVLGYGGNDSIDGGDGNDTVDGGVGDDQVRGGAGDDEMWGDHYKEPGADLLDGGPGTDYHRGVGHPVRPHRTSRARRSRSTASPTTAGPARATTSSGSSASGRSVVGDYVGTDGADDIKIINPGNEGPSSLTGLGGNDILVVLRLRRRGRRRRRQRHRRGRPRQRHRDRRSGPRHDLRRRHQLPLQLVQRARSRSATT